jgi:hypothetical protein
MGLSKTQDTDGVNVGVGQDTDWDIQTEMDPTLQMLTNKGLDGTSDGVSDSTQNNKMRYSRYISQKTSLVSSSNEHDGWRKPFRPQNQTLSYLLNCTTGL